MAEIWVLAAGVLLTVLVNAFWTVWWASSITARVRFLEQSITTSQDVRDRLTKVETVVHEIRNNLQNLVTALHLSPGSD